MKQKRNTKTVQNCEKTVKAIDLRQRKTRYRTWLGISVTASIVMLTAIYYSQWQAIDSLNQFLILEKTSDFLDSPFVFITLLVLLLFPMFFILFANIFCIEPYLSKLYFPERHQE